MWSQSWTNWLATIGLLLAVVGLGFVADRQRPFVQVGMLLGGVGLACFLVAGWVDFGRKSRL